MKHALFIVAKEGFRDEELFDTQKVLGDAEIETTIAATEPGSCTGKLGGTAQAQIGLNQVNAEDFDVVIFIGGPGSYVFQDDPAAHLIAQKTVEAGKILAAICAAPAILAKAGVLQNKKVTCFAADALYQILEENGANLSKAPLEVDGKLITADGPASATAFGEKIVEMLS